MAAKARCPVVIVGAGVAALETLLALRALAPGRLAITLVAPERVFVNRSMAVAQPFAPRRGRGLRLQAITDDADARWHRGIVDRIDHARRHVITRDETVLAYDVLVLAPGARLRSDWDADRALTYRDGRDAPSFRLLLHQIQTGRTASVAFVKPRGPSWPLPLYDLALMTGAACADANPARHRLVVVTPEDEPLAAFGPHVATAVRRLLEDRRIELLAGSSGTPGARGVVNVAPGDRRLAVDRVVTIPRLTGPRLRGIPCGADGFIDVDVHGRVAGLDGVFAAGDATAFAIKQGGVAAQQADAVAEAIAASVGADLDPHPFRPVLRGALLTGGAVHYLRADVSGCAGDDSEVSTEPLWWPPNRLSARFLGPYLAEQTGSALDVLPRDDRERRFVHPAREAKPPTIAP